MKLEIGTKGEASTMVVHDNTAAAVGAGGVEVFATPMMIALIENAAWRAVAHGLDAGDVYVGKRATSSSDAYRSAGASHC